MQWGLPLAAILLAVAPAVRAAVPTPLVLIGGGPDDPGIMAQALSLAGGANARVAILAAASSNPAEAAGAYQRYFSAYGVQADALALPTRLTAGSPAILRREAAADMLFFPGGDQSRLVAALAGTPLLGAIVDAWRRGTVVAGRSAGAMPWGASYIAGGTSQGALAVAFGKDAQGRRGLDVRPGLHLVDSLWVDTHFDERDRLGRLLLAEAATPSSTAVGIDEGTAAIMTGRTLHVMGDGVVTVLEASLLQGDNARQAGADRLFAAGPFEMERVVSGQQYVLGSERIAIPQLPIPPSPVSGGLFGWFGRSATPPSPVPEAQGAAGPAEPITLIGAATPPAPRQGLDAFVRDAGGSQARLLILAGDEAAPDAAAWRGALLRAGAGSAVIELAADLHDQSLASALEHATGVFFVEDELGTLLSALDADHRDLRDVAADYAQRLPMAAAGLGVRIVGDVAYFGRPGSSNFQVLPGLQLLRGMVADNSFWETGGLERLIQATLLAGHATGFGLGPASDLRIDRGQALVGGSTQVVVIEGNGVSAYTLPATDSAAPASARGLEVSVIPPSGAYDLVRHLPRF